MLSMIGARFRDLVQVIKNLTQVAFFLTPVMWNPQILPEQDRFIVMLNPFYSFVELIRAPLMGARPAWITFAMVTAITLIGMALCLKMFTRYRARIIYWL
jgi:ABC-type polysaccharide/polyol phosphate export permease